MNTKQSCAGCGKPLAPNAPQGLCPECLIRAGLGTGVSIEPATSAPGGRIPFTAPSLEEVARLFPQLEILALIGQGGMGAVYKARQKQLDRLVALKILPRNVGADTAFAERFMREAKALAKLNHPGIVTLYEFGQADGLYFFLMEFVDGVSLRHLLEGQRVSPREALAIVPQICDALQCAHDQGIVHRDIKPENILLDRQGRVKVADFGLAKLMGAEEAGTEAPGAVGATAAGLTASGKVMGTPQYMAPEQREHPSEVDHRADIFSLGVVFYEMLTGQPPIGKFPPPSRNVQIDVRLDEVVLRALEKEPERRYQQASEVKGDVETIAWAPTEASGAATAVVAAFSELPPEAKAVQKSLRIARIALFALGLMLWALVLFEHAAAQILPNAVARPIFQLMYAVHGHLPYALQLLDLSFVSHLVATLALISAWRLKNFRGFGFANAAILTSFFQLSFVWLTVPLGLLTLAMLWRQDVQFAFAVANARKGDRDANRAEAEIGWRLAIASIALVLLSYLCLPAFLGGIQEVSPQHGLERLLFVTIRWLHYWMPGVAMVFGLTALHALRYAGPPWKGLGCAVFSLLFYPCFWVTGRFFATPGQAPAPWHLLGLPPLDLEPIMERMLLVQLLTTAASALLAWGVAGRKARLVRAGLETSGTRFANRIWTGAWLICVGYIAIHKSIYFAFLEARFLPPNADRDLGFFLAAIIAVVLTRWLVDRMIKRGGGYKAIVLLRWLKWTCWAGGIALAAHTGFLLIPSVYRQAWRGGGLSLQSFLFLDSHIHAPVAAGSESTLPRADLRSGLVLEAISEPAASEVLCWLPDGAIRCRQEPEVGGQATGRLGSRELIFCLTAAGTPAAPAGLHWECVAAGDGMERSCSESYPAFDTTPLGPHSRVDDVTRHGIKAITIKIPREAKTARLGLGVPAETWEDTDAVWAWAGNVHSLNKRSIRHGDTDWEFGPVDLAETQGELVVSFYSQSKRDADARLIALDTTGQVHVPRYTVGSMSAHRFIPAFVGVTDFNEAHFPGMALNRLKELRFQVRRCQWVEFRNISLVPGQKTEVKVVTEGEAVLRSNEAQPPF